MSGIGEASLVIGMISSIISIIEAVKEVYDAVDDDSGLPKNFKKSAAKLPLIARLLEDAETYVKSANNDTQTAFMPTLKNCQQQAEKLQGLFSKVMPEDNDSRAERYLKAARTIGKGGRVETLTKGILEDLQLMATKFPAITPPKKKQELEKAIEEVSKMEPSLPDGFEENHGFAHYGSGAQNNNTGSGIQHNNSGAGNQNSGSGQQYIGTNHIVNHIKSNKSSPHIVAPFQNFPFRQNIGFVMRKEIFTALRQKLTSLSRHQNAVLWGLSGSGKTQIALEFAYRLHNETSCFVFWVHGESYTTFLHDYKVIAQKAGLLVQLKKNHNDNDLMNAVRIWIESMSNWLLVIDNADDLTQFKPRYTSDASKKSSSLYDFIPRGKNGKILWTSCDRKIQAGLLKIKEGIHIDNMQMEEAKELLGELSGCDITQDPIAVEKLIDLLDRFPLAILQAATYMSRTSISVTEYSRMFEKEDERWKLFENLDLDAPEAPKSVLQTLQISIDYIRRANLLSFKILHTISYFNSQSIQFELIKAAIRSPDNAKEGSINTSAFFTTVAFAILPVAVLAMAVPYANFDLLGNESKGDGNEGDGNDKDVLEAVARLEEFSMLQKEDGKRWYNMHKLVQEGTRYTIRQLKSKHNYERLHFSKTALNILLRSFPDSSQNTWATCEALLPHALAISSWSELSQEQISVADLLNKVSNYFADQHRWEEKESIDLKILKLRTQRLGAKNPYTILGIGQLSNTYKQQDRLNEAGRLRLEMLKLMREVLSERNSNTIWSIVILASIYHKQDHLNEAEKMYMETLESELKRMAEKHKKELKELKEQLKKAINDKNKDNIGALKKEFDKVKREGNKYQKAFAALKEEDKYREALLAWRDAEIAETSMLQRDERADKFLKALIARKDLEFSSLQTEKNDGSLADNDGDAPLIQASSNGNIEVVRSLLDKGADISVTNKDGWTPLYIASSNGHLEVVKFLLEKDADLSIGDNIRCTPLIAASGYGHLEIVKLLLERGADLSIATNNGWTPLNAASSHGHLEIVKLLLERGADLSIATNDGWTPLNAASSHGHLEIVKLLLERGADLSIATNNGWTPLNIASYSGHLEVVKLLLENTQVDTTKRDNNGRTAFFYAAMRGHHELVQLLLARSPLELYTHDCYNVTPLLAAVRNGHEKVAELLLAADEICIHSIDCFGRTLMCSAKRSRNTQLIQLIHHYATRAGLQIDDIDTSKQSELVPFDLSLAWCDICTSCIRDDSDYYTLLRFPTESHHHTSAQVRRSCRPPGIGVFVEVTAISCVKISYAHDDLYTKPLRDIFLDIRDNLCRNEGIPGLRNDL
ncbi:hypothetical protein ACMFMG_009350 [Clarireedia jacksonii]